MEVYAREKKKSMKSRENYQLSPEEIEKAEDNMSETEKRLSEIRNVSVENFKRNTGKSGMLNLLNKEMPRIGDFNVIMSKWKIAGEIEGHQIELVADADHEDNDRFYNYRGLIDGKELTMEDAQMLWEKYHAFAEKLNLEEEELKKRARTENALKDVL